MPPKRDELLDELSRLYCIGIGLEKTRWFIKELETHKVSDEWKRKEIARLHNFQKKQGDTALVPENWKKIEEVYEEDMEQKGDWLRERGLNNL